jgi:RNA polymerase sigma-70 factor (ECF subfamily)
MPAADDSNLQDLALLRRVQAGDRAAFEALYLAYHRRVSRFLARLTRQPERIEEIVNDTLWVVWRNASGFQGESRVSTWIMGIAWRCGLKALRRNATAVEVPLDENEVDTVADEGFATQELRDWLLRGLDQLVPEQRAAVELAYYHGHSCEEIAEIMGCAAGTVKARLFHARVKLRSLLPQLGGAEAGDRREVG